MTTQPIIVEESSTVSPRMPTPWQRMLFASGVLIAVGLGSLLGRFAPIHRVDWIGLSRGRRPAEVFVEALGRPLTRTYQILLLGTDLEPNDPDSFRSRTDTLIMVRLDPKRPGISLLSIPRDTRVELPTHGTNKINAANVFGGVELTRGTVSMLLEGTRIDRHILIDTRGLVSLVDALGGLELTVPQRMVYEDKTQKLKIDLYPGKQVLNGQQVEGFVRYRGDADADLGRIRRQKLMLQALRAKFNDPTLITRLPHLVAITQRHIRTDLDFEELLAIGTFLFTVPPANIETLTLGGRASDPYVYNTSYWLIEAEDIRQAINRARLDQEGRSP
ncbi:MAG: LCP family protein [Oscillatoriales cyanobacterium SM2_2_1]|nr:LCP family protein [Oscillatoriales cyanobacterium SM2_2_1]